VLQTMGISYHIYDIDSPCKPGPHDAMRRVGHVFLIAPDFGLHTNTELLPNRAAPSPGYVKPSSSS